MAASERTVQLIPVEHITVLNPRVRNVRIFNEIISNIDHLGLKKPITVSRRETPDGHRYDLVCGQGRLEAYQALGQREIPALVVDADPSECLVMSLVENCARRQHRAIDLLQDIEGLKRRGYSPVEIAQKTDLSVEYVRGVLRLFEQCEHRLLRAVVSGQMPLSVAVQIADTDDEGAQRALQEAYESKLLRGRSLMIAKHVVDQRQQRGKGLRSTSHAKPAVISATSLIRAYREQTEKKRIMIRKAEATHLRLIFLTEALRKLLGDENFVTLLRAEGLGTLPSNIADRLPGARQSESHA